MRAPVSRALAAVALPFAALALVLGCPRDKEATPGTAPSASVSASAQVAPSASASAAWPKVIVVPNSAAPEDAGVFTDDELDADVDAFADGDAFAPDGDAMTDGDAADVHKHDAYDDAPLLGTKTYPDENPMKGIRKVTSAAAIVRKAPRNGDVIGTLPKGTEISLVGEIYDWYRVRYSDPNTGVWRQGWVYMMNFVGPRMKTCPTGWTWHPQDGGWCDRECTKNTDCKGIKGYKCSGTMCFYAAD